MTPFLAWAGVDTHGVSSMYFASDSRISWTGSQFWNYGQKLFAARFRPDIFGFIGDVTFPSIVLGQIVSHIDDAAYFAESDDFEKRCERLIDDLSLLLSEYPDEYRKNFSVVYGTREGEGVGSKFSVRVFSWNTKEGWSQGNAAFPETSGPLTILGSGTRSIDKWQERWNKTSQGGTSRSIFSAFCDALYEGLDSRSGGAPQLVGMYRKFPAKTFGVIYREKSYLLGLPVKETSGVSFCPSVEWRNAIFERCDIGGRLIRSAQKHNVPSGLGKSLGRNKR